MTPRELFDRAYLRTCHAHQVAPDESQAAECYEVVRVYPASLYDPAATRLNGMSKWLPKPAEWLEVVSDLASARERQEREDQAAEWARQAGTPTTYHCAVCHDTGWEPGDCTADHWCGRCRIHKQHLYDHPYVTECACRATNPVYQEKRHRAQPATAESGPSQSEARRLKAHYERGRASERIASDAA